MDKKQYPIPDELADIYRKALGAEALRDRYAKMRFLGYKNALRASTECEDLKRDFWYKVRQLYPELSKKGITLSEDFSYVTVLDGKEE